MRGELGVICLKIMVAVNRPWVAAPPYALTPLPPYAVPAKGLLLRCPGAGAPPPLSPAQGLLVSPYVGAPGLRGLAATRLAAPLRTFDGGFRLQGFSTCTTVTEASGPPPTDLGKR